MDAMFNDQYYNASDNDKDIEDNDINMQLMNDQVDDLGKVIDEELGSDEEALPADEIIQAQKDKKLKKFEDKLGESVK